MSRVLRGGLIAAAVCGMLLALGAYLVATPAGLKTLTRATAGLTGGRIMLEGAEGRLADAFAFRRVQVATI